MSGSKSVPAGAAIVLGFALLAAAAFPCRMASAQSGEVGSIEGTVTFVGDIPKSSVTDDAGVRRDLLEVDDKTRGLRHVVVYLTRADGSAIPRQADRPPHLLQGVVMDQVDYAFKPRVLAVQAGEAITFTNSDPANHNVRTSASNKTNEFNVFTGIDGKYQHRFGIEPQHRPIRLGCDIHPWMRGWIFVFDHPYFGVTDKDGRFRIAGAPTGECQLSIIQPDIGHTEQRKVNVSANNASKVDVVVRRDGIKPP